MTKPIHVHGRGAIQHERHERVTRTPLRIAMRLWGYDPMQVQAWIESLPTLNGSLTWAIALTPDSPGADIQLHMVKPSRVVGTGFCWNYVGANRALAKMQAANGTALALFAGHAQQLPTDRSGLWIAAGALPPRAALFRLAHLIVAATTQASSGAITLRHRVLEMIACDLDVG